MKVVEIQRKLTNRFSHWWQGYPLKSFPKHKYLIYRYKGKETWAFRCRCKVIVVVLLCWYDIYQVASPNRNKIILQSGIAVFSDTCRLLFLRLVNTTRKTFRAKCTLKSVILVLRTEQGRVFVIHRTLKMVKMLHGQKRAEPERYYCLNVWRVIKGYL